MSINEQIEQYTKEYLGSDALKEHIRKQAQEMVNKSIDDALSSYGSVKKQIDEAIKNEIQLNVEDLGVRGLSTFLTDVIKEKLHTGIREDAHNRISKELEEMLSPIEKKVSIETLKEKLLEEADTYSIDVCGDVTLDMLDGESGYFEDDIFTFIVEKPSNPSYGWVTIHMDPKPGKDSYDSMYRLTVHENSTSYRMRDKEIRGQDKSFGYSFEFEDFIYRMYLNKSTVDYEDAKRHA